MANDLPRTIDDLTDPEFRALMKERMPFIRVRQSDLLWQRYKSLAEEARRLEARSAEAWSAWMVSRDAISLAHDEAVRAAKHRRSTFTRINRAYRAAQEAGDKAEAARIRADAAASRMRKRADAVYAAWDAACEASRAEREES